MSKTAIFAAFWLGLLAGAVSMSVGLVAMGVASLDLHTNGSLRGSP